MFRGQATTDSHSAYQQQVQQQHHQQQHQQQQRHHQPRQQTCDINGEQVHQQEQELDGNQQQHMVYGRSHSTPESYSHPSNYNQQHQQQRQGGPPSHHYQEQQQHQRVSGSTAAPILQYSTSDCQANYQQQQQNQHPNQQHHYQQQQQQNGPRAKCDQVVYEAIAKTVELIVKSRSCRGCNSSISRTNERSSSYNSNVNNKSSVTNIGPYGRGTVLNNNGSSGSRFNLEMEEIPKVRLILSQWKRSLHVPLRLDIIYHPANNNMTYDNNGNNNGTGGNSVLLERWHLDYTSPSSSTDPSASSSTTASPEDEDMVLVQNNQQYSKSKLLSHHYRPRMMDNDEVLIQLRKVCKRVVVFLRTLHCLTRMMPSYAIAREVLKATTVGQQQHGERTNMSAGDGYYHNGQHMSKRTNWLPNSGNAIHLIGGGVIDFTLYAAAANSQEEEMQQRSLIHHSFNPIPTPYGLLNLCVYYENKPMERIEEAAMQIQQLQVQQSSSANNCHPNDDRNRNDSIPLPQGTTSRRRNDGGPANAARDQNTNVNMDVNDNIGASAESNSVKQISEKMSGLSLALINNCQISPLQQQNIETTEGNRGDISPASPQMMMLQQQMPYKTSSAPPTPNIQNYHQPTVQQQQQQQQQQHSNRVTIPNLGGAATHMYNNQQQNNPSPRQAYSHDGRGPVYAIHTRRTKSNNVKITNSNTALLPHSQQQKQQQPAYLARSSSPNARYFHPPNQQQHGQNTLPNQYQKQHQYGYGYNNGYNYLNNNTNNSNTPTTATSISSNSPNSDTICYIPQPSLNSNPSSLNSKQLQQPSLLQQQQSVPAFIQQQQRKNSSSSNSPHLSSLDHRTNIMMTTSLSLSPSPFAAIYHYNNNTASKTVAAAAQTLSALPVVQQQKDQHNDKKCTTNQEGNNNNTTAASPSSNAHASASEPILTVPPPFERHPTRLIETNSNTSGFMRNTASGVDDVANTFPAKSNNSNNNNGNKNLTDENSTTIDKGKQQQQNSSSHKNVSNDRNGGNDTDSGDDDKALPTSILLPANTLETLPLSPFQMAAAAAAENGGTNHQQSLISNLSFGVPMVIPPLALPGSMGGGCGISNGIGSGGGNFYSLGDGDAAPSGGVEEQQRQAILNGASSPTGRSLLGVSGVGISGNGVGFNRYNHDIMCSGNNFLQDSSKYYSVTGTNTHNNNLETEVMTSNSKIHNNPATLAITATAGALINDNTYFEDNYNEYNDTNYENEMPFAADAPNLLCTNGTNQVAGFGGSVNKEHPPMLPFVDAMSSFAHSCATAGRLKFFSDCESSNNNIPPLNQPLTNENNEHCNYYHKNSHNSNMERTATAVSQGLDSTTSFREQNDELSLYTAQTSYSNQYNNANSIPFSTGDTENSSSYLSSVHHLSNNSSGVYDTNQNSSSMADQLAEFRDFGASINNNNLRSNIYQGDGSHISTNNHNMVDINGKYASHSNAGVGAIIGGNSAIGTSTTVDTSTTTTHVTSR